MHNKVELGSTMYWNDYHIIIINEQENILERKFKNSNGDYLWLFAVHYTQANEPFELTVSNLLAE